MKYIVDAIVVVEGKGDECFLSSFIDAEYIITNGFDVPEDEVDYLKHAKAYKQIIVLTDSDDAGKRIRSTLNSKIDGLTNIELDIDQCNKNGKHGVAESTKEEVVNKLKPYFVKEKPYQNPINTLIIKTINSKEIRDNLCKKFHLGKCNTKTMIKRMETLNIKIEDIKEVVGGVYGD